jgi:hypothetical protein
VEDIALACNVAYEAGVHQVKMDITNAFPTVKRYLAIKLLPTLLPYDVDLAANLYCGTIPTTALVQLHDGTYHDIEVSDGGSIGCGIGGLLFVAAMHSVLTEFKRRFGPHGLRIKAGMDDTTLHLLPYHHRLDHPLNTAAVQFLEHRWSQLGLHIAPQKQQILLGPMADPPDDGEHIWAARVVHHCNLTDRGELLAYSQQHRLLQAAGMEIMGVPVGSCQYKSAWVEEKFTGRWAQRSVNAVSRMTDLQAAAWYLTSSVIPAYNFTLRTVIPDIVLSFAKRFDMMAVYAATVPALKVESVAGSITPTWHQVVHPDTSWPTFDTYMYESQRRQVQLQSSAGGLGITSLATTAQPAYVGMTALSLPRVLNLLPPQVLKKVPFRDPTSTVGGLLKCLFLGKEVDMLPHKVISAAWNEVFSACPKGIGVQQALASLQRATVFSALMNGEISGHGRDTPPPEALSSTPSSPSSELRVGVQGVLSRLIHKRLQQEVLEYANTYSNDLLTKSRRQAGLRSVMGRAAGSWLHNPPVQGSIQRMTPQEYAHALRLRVGFNIDYGVACPATSHAHQRTDHTLDTSHIRTCMGTGKHNFAHHRMVHTVAKKLLGGAGVGPIPGITVEDKRMFAGSSHGSDYRMDIMIPANTIEICAGQAGSDDNRAIGLDVTLVEPTSLQYLIGTGGTSATTNATQQYGFAAATAEKTKIKHYQGHFDSAYTTFIPLAFESGGTLGRQGRAFLTMLARHAAGPPIVDGSINPHYARVMRKLRVILAVQLQRILCWQTMATLKVIKDRHGSGPRGIQPVLLVPHHTENR